METEEMPENTCPEYLSIHLDETNKKVIASFTPEGDTEAITPEQFRQAIEAAGFGGYRILQTPVANATEKYNAGEAFEIAIGEAVDGKFSIHTDSRQMAVYLSCTLALGGAPVVMQSILEEAAKKGITATLDSQAIEKTLLEGGDNILIARGQAPVPGEDGKLESLIPSMKERTPRLDEDGLADFRELGDIVTVQAGEVLVRRIPATPGTPGQTVTGKELPAKPGKDITFATKMEGAIVDPNDPNALVAAISGCPTIIKNGVTVDPVYTVKNVDLHCGNIAFSGAVHITGDVHTDMTVNATGDIYVDGTVENAILDSGGDIVVKGGIIGSSELHTGRDAKFHAAIKCTGNCTARFAQNAHIHAGQGIFIHEVAMLSELSAGHQIIVGDEGSRKGEIIGGIAHATMLVKAKDVGSPEAIRTRVIAGPDAELLECHSAAVKACEAAEHKLADLLKLLDLAHQHPGKLPPASIHAAEATRDSLNAELESLRANELELQKEIDLANKAQVIVAKRVFGGTDILIGAKHFNTLEDREGGVFRLDEEGEMVFD